MAQDWPSKPVRIVTGFAAGGIGDLGARLLADHITRTTGQQAVVENRTGAAGTLGMDAVAKAAPDGTTTRPRAQRQSRHQSVHPEVDAVRRAEGSACRSPVIGDAPQMIAISTEVPAKTFKEFQALAKEKPGTFSYGSAGPGSLPHLSMAEFAQAAGIQLVHVPYRGNAPAMTDLIAGRIQLVSSSIGQFRPAMDAGKNPAACSPPRKTGCRICRTCRPPPRRGCPATDERVDRRRRAGRHARSRSLDRIHALVGRTC